MEAESQIKPTDLRGILKYVPMFRGQTFVIAIDGSVVAHENFRNVLMDLAVLRSLNIRLVIVYGVGRQIRQLAENSGSDEVDAYGEGPTDEKTLKLAQSAASEVGFAIVSALTQLGIQCALTNAVRLTEVGIVRGVDHGATARVEKVDHAFLGHLVREDVVPVVQPVGSSREGRLLRVNSDLAATAVAAALNANKLIFLTSYPGLLVDGKPALNLPAEELTEIVERDPCPVDPRLVSKAKAAVTALETGTPRVHLLDGRVFGALLTEVFDKVGLGTMIHSNDYQQIRPAKESDAHAIHALILNAARSDALRSISFESIRENLGHYFLYEIDGSLVACAALHPYPGEPVCEVASVFVLPAYQGRGVGSKLVRFAEREARRHGARKLLALSTQNSAFFRNSLGFEEGSPEDLPETRRAQFLNEKRNSRILVRRIDAETPATPDLRP